MAKIDRSEIKQLVRDLRAEASTYSRQWLSWLGLASAGGAIALLSFAANLPDPDFALRVLFVPLAAFAGGVCSAGLAVLSAAKCSELSEIHHGAALTRDELADAIKSMPVMISASQIMANKHNKPRDELIEENGEEHELAETAWESHVRWRRARFAFVALSMACFVIGLISPLAFIACGVKFSPG